MLREVLNTDILNFQVTLSFLPLGLICMMVILGNTLIICAVYISPKLRRPTDKLIVSLAVADLLLGKSNQSNLFNNIITGIFVLPISSVYEVVGIWVFGRYFCFIWLSVDVWVCTASILNLVAISLDRYIALTHPISYSIIMTSNR